MTKDISKYSAASKARWAKRSPEERSERMRTIAKKKWDSMSADEKRAHAYKMLEGKKNDLKVSETQ